MNSPRSWRSRPLAGCPPTSDGWSKPPVTDFPEDARMTLHHPNPARHVAGLLLMLLAWLLPAAAARAAVDESDLLPVDQAFALTAVAPEPGRIERSEEHTSELQSRENLVCRLLLEK